MRENGYSYNDYLKLTRAYLKNLPFYRRAADNLEMDIRDAREQLKEITVRAVSYEGVSGGTGELTPTERAAEARLRSAERISSQELEYRALRNQCKRLELAIETLPPEEREAIELIYFEHFSYAAMARRLFLSERTCKRRLNQGVRKIAVMLFGLKAEERILFVS